MDNRLTVCAVFHSAVLASVVSYPIWSGNLSGVYWIVPALGISVGVVLYLRTGIPGVYRQECDDCGSSEGAGKLYCSNCGCVTGSDIGHPQIVWFFGYGYLLSFFVTLLTSGHSGNLLNTLSTAIPGAIWTYPVSVLPWLFIFITPHIIKDVY